MRKSTSSSKISSLAVLVIRVPYNDQTISISVPGINNKYRIRLPFQCRQDILSEFFTLKHFSFSVLKYYKKKKEFYLHVTVDYSVTYNDYDKVVGVDLGIEYMLVYVDGTTYQVIHDPELFRSSEHHRDLCAELQAKGTRSSKRRLKSLKGKQTRLGLDTLHCVAKSFVESCIRNKVGIVVMEDLTNIRKNMKGSKKTNFKTHSWAFRKLQNIIEYKCKLAGIRVVYVKPAYTSVTCPRCGHRSKENRPTRDLFCCQQCQLSGPADVVAAYNIRQKFLAASAARGAVSRPQMHVVSDNVRGEASSCL